MSAVSEKPRKTSMWGGFFSVLDKLHLKESVTRTFIFRPPKQS